MISLALGDTTTTKLHGALVVAPVRGAFYDRPGLSGDIVKDSIDVTVEGTPAEIQTFCSYLEMWFTKARAYYANRIGVSVRLQLQESPAEAVYHSPILDGWLEKLKGIKEKGSAVYRVHVIRENYWESATPNTLTVSNLHGSGAAATIYNHNDAAHENKILISASQAAGDLPAPVILRVTNTAAAGASGVVYVGCHGNHLDDQEFDHWLEGEEGVGGANVGDGNSSNGNYKSLAWAAVGDTWLLSWTISSLMQRYGQGRYYRPLIRFAGPMLYTDLWVQLNIYAASSYVYSGPWTLLTPNVALQELPAIQIPPHRVNATTFLPLSLALHARRAGGAGGSTLDVDYLQLTSLDSWRKLTPLGTGLAVNDVLIDDNRQNQVYQLNGANVFSEYMGEGAPLILQPGRRHVLYLLHMLPDGTAPIARTSSVAVQIHPRYRRI